MFGQQSRKPRRNQGFRNDASKQERVCLTFGDALSRPGPALRSAPEKCPRPSCLRSCLRRRIRFARSSEIAANFGVGNRNREEMLYLFLSICVIISPAAETTPRIIEPDASEGVCAPCGEVERDPCPCPDMFVEEPCGPCEEVEWDPCPCADMVVEELCGPCGDLEAVPPAPSMPSSPVHAASWHSLGSKFGLGDDWSHGSAARSRTGFAFGGGNLPSGGGSSGGSSVSSNGESLPVLAGEDSSTFPYSDLPDAPFPQYDSSTAPPVPTESENIVPEPGSLAIWSGLALIGAIAAWRRRRLA